MAYVPGRVRTGPLEPPPQDANSKPPRSIPITAKERRLLLQTTARTTNPTPTAGHSGEDEETDASEYGIGSEGSADAVEPVVCIVTLAEPEELPLNTTEPGEIVQVDAGGAPLQLRDTV